MLWISGEALPFLSGFFCRGGLWASFFGGTSSKKAELGWRLACPECPQQVAEASVWQPQPRSLCGTSSILESPVYAEILSHAAGGLEGHRCLCSGRAATMGRGLIQDPVLCSSHCGGLPMAVWLWGQVGGCPE
uniref:Uncharacterized protein n=1 Tax=Macaca nemestrina TaxID=9545 RepID=A0A2K6DZD1_MACNE